MITALTPYNPDYNIVNSALFRPSSIALLSGHRQLIKSLHHPPSLEEGEGEGEGKKGGERGGGERGGERGVGGGDERGVGKCFGVEVA